MLTHILQIIMCISIIASCVYSIIGENRRQKQMDEIFKSMKRRHEKEISYE